MQKKHNLKLHLFMYFSLSQANLELLKLLKSKEFSIPNNARWEGSERHPLSSVLYSLREYTLWFRRRIYDRTTLNSLFVPLGSLKKHAEGDIHKKNMVLHKKTLNFFQPSISKSIIIEDDDVSCPSHSNMQQDLNKPIYIQSKVPSSIFSIPFHVHDK